MLEIVRQEFTNFIAKTSSFGLEFEVNVLGGQCLYVCMGEGGISTSSSACGGVVSVYACAGQDNDFQRICMPRKHGCIGLWIKQEVY